MMRRGVLISVPVAICLAIEFILGAPTKGTIASGAFICGFAAFDAPARQRMRWQAAVALLIGLSATAGILTSQTASIAVVSMLVVGMLGGYCVSISPWMGTVGLLAALSFLVAQGLFVPSHVAPEALLWACVGGLSQSLWSAIVSLKDRTAPDRKNGWNRAAAWAACKENFRFSSDPMRHALRLGGALAVGVAIYRILGLTDHGFWIPLTVVFAMKSEREETLTRLVMRGVGTLAGLAVATVAVDAFAGSEVLIWALVVVFAASSYGLLSIHYGLFTAAITAYIIVLTVHEGEAPLLADGQRIIGTVAGLVLAFAAFIILPNKKESEGPRERDLTGARESIQTS